MGWLVGGDEEGEARARRKATTSSAVISLWPQHLYRLASVGRGEARMRRQVDACVCVGGAGGEQLLHRPSLPPSLSVSGLT